MWHLFVGLVPFPKTGADIEASPILDMLLDILDMLLDILDMLLDMGVWAKHVPQKPSVSAAATSRYFISVSPQIFPPVIYQRGGSQNGSGDHS